MWGLGFFSIQERVNLTISIQDILEVPLALGHPATHHDKESK